MLFNSGSSVVLVTTTILLIDYQSYGLPLKKDRLQCDPLEHKYYLTQFGVCSDCDKCFPGDELQPIEGANLGMGLYGATLCLGCQQCKKGTFNSEQNLQWYCSPCTVCADQGMIETTPCTPISDTICNDTPPPYIQPPMNNMKNSSMVLPYTDRDKQGDSRFHAEFLAITALSLIFLITVATVVYRLWRKKHRRIPTAAEKLAKFQALDKADACVCTDSGLHDILEEHSGDEDAALIPQCEHGDSSKKRKRKEKISTKVRELQDPNLRLRRRQSCQLDYQRCNKVGPIAFSKSFDLNDKVTEFNVHGFRRPRLKSLPVTTPELDDCKSSLCQRAPSDGFIQFLSKLLAGDRNYRAFAKEAGLEDFNITLTETEFQDRHIADVSYEVIKRLLQKRPNLSVVDIYEILDKIGLQERHKILEEKIEKFKISLT